ncbi:MAG: ABC transporter substrate-binding protein [Candidatus Bipolaricaulota bacterium]|nr:ABC transporter substrate-binding protein [Candidatus Bipolaricaulota bacterium]MCS7274267.1 ABC transporter substrate-binding protein [Candidatus Bipolaricaulota bacterium]MDW8111051.1 ABC transporter substrate-binding protein [Candidatus Bipolaricaulota bacterium]MDW8329762.1 ABC transporter substrate-binding protein [Candidatus Bipolaricaulota bacterium]
MNLQKQTLRRRTFLKGLGATVGALTFTGAFRGPLLAQPPPVTPIGTLLDYTGALAEYGPAIRTGIELAERHLNEAAREVLGGPIVRLIHEDSGTSPTVGVDRAKKLVEVDKVPAYIGSLASGVTIPIAETVSKPTKTLQISPSSTSPLITDLADDDFLFRTCPSDALQGVVLAMLARGELVAGVRYDTAATIFIDNPYGRGLDAVFTRGFEKRGGRVLARVPHPIAVQPSYAAEIRRALADRPAVLAVMSYPGHANIFIREAIELLGYRSFLFSDGTKSLEMIRALGPAALEGQYGTAPAAALTESYRTFLTEYGRVYGRGLPPLPFIDTGYDAMATIGLSLVKTLVDRRPITGEQLRNNLRVVSNPPGTVKGVTAFRSAFESLRRGEDINYEGAAGSVDFNEKGDVVSPIGVFRYRGGTIEEVVVVLPAAIPAE